MTYSEIKYSRQFVLEDNTGFDWKECCKEALRSAPPPLAHQELICLSCSWDTCACGNLDPSIPRKLLSPHIVAPVDEELRAHGASFCACVFRGDWKAALRCLSQINRRGEEVLAELNTPDALPSPTH